MDMGVVQPQAKDRRITRDQQGRKEMGKGPP